MRLLLILVPVFLSLQVAGSPNLPTDTLPAQNVNTLSKLQDGDTLSVQFMTQGCFHYGTARMVISREGEQLVARLFPGVSRSQFTRGQKKKPNVVKVVTLTDMQVQAYAKFERELRLASDEGCTTTDDYVVCSKFLQLRKTDGTCRWNGFNYLTKAFFGEK